MMHATDSLLLYAVSLYRLEAAAKWTSLIFISNCHRLGYGKMCACYRPAFRLQQSIENPKDDVR